MNIPVLGSHGATGFSEVVVMDTETTGLSPFGIAPDDGRPTGDPYGPDRLCSVAAYLFRESDGMWMRDRSATWLVDPERPVPEAAAAVNGFAWSPGGNSPGGRTNLAGMPRFAEIAPDLMHFIGSRPVCFHNAVFDAGVLDAELVRAGLEPLPMPILCTKKAFSDMLGLGRPDHYVSGTNLNRLCDHLGVDRAARFTADGQELHGAGIDALLAAHCFARLEPLGWMVAEDPASLPHRRMGLLAVPGAGSVPAP